MAPLTERRGLPVDSPLFKIPAMLKLNWCRDHELLDRGSLRAVAGRVRDFPPAHPYEQVLGYLAMHPDEQVSRTAGTRLKNLAWPDTLVALIAILFRLQIGYQASRSLDKDLVEEVEARVEGSMRTMWDRARLFDRLAQMERPDYTGRGPLTVLSFNHC